MIDLYTSPTPNGYKASVTLEELELPYNVHTVDLQKGDQKTPEFLAINPNGRIPAIVDHDFDALPIFESGAIMIHLAEKTGKLLPSEAKARARVLSWLMFQMGGLGPNLGQAHHFLKYNQGKAPYAETRFHEEAKRLYGVLNRRLAEAEFLAGAYSIADMASWPWVSRYEWQQIDLAEFPSVLAWYRRIAERGAVQRGYAVPFEVNPIPIP